MKTVAEIERAILLGASAYCRQTGKPHASLKSLAPLLSVNGVDTILQFYLNRASARLGRETHTSPQAYQQGRLFCQIAQSRVTAQELSRMRMAVRTTNPPLQRRLSKRTHGKLERLLAKRSDVEQQMTLPFIVFEELASSDDADPRRLRRMGVAVALALIEETHLPLSRIAAAEFDRDVRLDSTGGACFRLSKNDRIILSASMSRMLTEYRRRMAMSEQAPGKVLFPGRSRKTLHPRWLSLQVGRLADPAEDRRVTGHELRHTTLAWLKHTKHSQPLTRRFRFMKLAAKRDRAWQSFENITGQADANEIVSAYVSRGRGAHKS